jgi:putative glycosyltransferase (TIGR04348 family)
VEVLAAANTPVEQHVDLELKELTSGEVKQVAEAEMTYDKRRNSSNPSRVFPITFPVLLSVKLRVRVDAMRILILTPKSLVARSGNLHTAERWAELLSELGHEAAVTVRYTDQEADLLIALHGEKTQEGLMLFHAVHPEAPCLVLLAGTDLYPELSPISLKSLEVADGIIVLQEKALKVVPERFADKVSVVIQSVERLVITPKEDRGSEGFDVCVVGHLREVKAPLLTARAARSLPATSRIRIRHGGGIIETQYREWVATEEAANPRYQWLGELDRAATVALIADSDILVLTSVTEGGPAVIGEAIVAGTPVLSTNTDGAVGLLGADYPGLFPVGDQAALTALLRRCEEDDAFYELLKQSAAALIEQFLPEREKASLALAIQKATSK